MRLWEKYRVVRSVEEALETLTLCRGRARIIAGGTDIIPKLREGELAVDCVVDVTTIDGLGKIEVDGTMVKIGASVTHHQVSSSPLLKETLPLLVEAAAKVGTPQVRNQGTIGGNIVNAQPAADTAVALLALGAEVRVVSQRGSVWSPLEDLYEDVGISRVKSDQELVVEVRCPRIEKNQGYAYLRMRGRNDHWLPTLNTAILVTTKGKRFVCGSIALGPVAPRLFRSREAEEWLKESSLTEKTIAAVAQKASEEASPRDSLLRGSREYRKEMVALLVRDALRKAIEHLKRS